MSSDDVAAAIDLRSVRERILISELERRGYITDDRIYRHPFKTFEFDEAEARLRRGEIGDALIWLERALPRGFSGLADAVIPFLPSRSVRP